MKLGLLKAQTSVANWPGNWPDLYSWFNTQTKKFNKKTFGKKGLISQHELLNI